MESLSSSGELSDICRDMSLSERLSNHIVQQTLTRQRWPPPCALIIIARGCGNPRQGPAENLITTIAPSLLNAYCCLPTSWYPGLPVTCGRSTQREGPSVIILALRYTRPTMLRLSCIIAAWSVQPLRSADLHYLSQACAPSFTASLTLFAILAHGHDSHFDISTVSMHPGQP